MTYTAYIYMHIYIYIYSIHIYMVMYVIMKAMRPPGCHHNDIVVTCTWALDVLWSHVPKCMSCYKAIMVTTGRVYCFHDNIYVMPILLL